MDYTFTVMNQKEAEEIAYNWHYEGKYSFYDIEAASRRFSRVFKY